MVRWIRVISLGQPSEHRGTGRPRHTHIESNSILYSSAVKAEVSAR